MKTYHKISIIFVFFALFLAFSPRAHAMYPTLSLSALNNNNVQVVVNADPNAQVTLYYRNTNSYGVSAGVIGSTNYYGYLSTTLGGNNYAIPYNAEVYVIVNGFTSQAVRWPYNGYGNYYNYNGIVLSSANISLKSGQQFTLTPQSNSGSFYISSNSNSQVASANVYNSNQITINGLTPGYTTITLCGYSSSCATFYITVQASLVDNSYYSNYPNYNNNNGYYGTGNSYLPPITYYPSNNYNDNYYSNNNAYYASNSYYTPYLNNSPYFSYPSSSPYSTYSTNYSVYPNTYFAYQY